MEDGAGGQEAGGQEAATLTASVDRWTWLAGIQWDTSPQEFFPGDLTWFACNMRKKDSWCLVSHVDSKGKNYHVNGKASLHDNDML